MYVQSPPACRRKLVALRLLVPHAQDERSILQDTRFLLAIRKGRQV